MNQYHDLIFNAPDEMVRMSVLGGQARVMMARVTRMAQDARDTHLASDVATAAMARVLTGCAMLSTMLKEEKGSVTLSVQGDGVGGRITAVGHGGDIKIACQYPQEDLPLLPDGKQDVAGFVGASGRLTVVKDFGAGDPYVGMSTLVSGSIAEDLAQYYTTSEQTPTLLALGCLNQDGVVLSAGGILVQAMPGCSEESLNKLEMRIPFFANISRELFDRSIEDLAGFWFQDMDLEIFTAEPLRLKCDCSRRKMEKALLAAGREELSQMIAEGKDTEMTCHFCRTARTFTPQDLTALMQNGAR